MGNFENNYVPDPDFIAAEIDSQSPAYSPSVTNSNSSDMEIEVPGNPGREVENEVRAWSAEA